MNQVKTNSAVYAIHAPDADKLAQVVEEMKALGRPTIRVVNCGDFFMALEGSHRLAAAHQLEIFPDFEVIDSDELINIENEDWYEACNWDGTEYTAGEVAGELRSGHNEPYCFDHC